MEIKIKSLWIENGYNLEGFHFENLYCTNQVKMFWMCFVRLKNRILGTLCTPEQIKVNHEAVNNY